MKQADKELFEAVKSNRTQDVETALEAGANVNARNSCEQTPLHFAASRGHTEIARLLLEKGADINPVDVYQETPRARAIRMGRPDMFDLLRHAAEKAAGHADRVEKRRDASEKRER